MSGLGAGTYTLSAGSGTFSNITVSDGAHPVQLGSNITATGSVTIGAGTLDTKGFNLALTGGSLTVALGATLQNSGGATGTVSIDGTGTIGGAGSFTAQNLTIGTTAATTTLGGAITVTSLLTVSAGGTLDGGFGVSAGTASVNGAIGSGTRLSSISVTGATGIGANIKTTGAQSYGAVTLAASVGTDSSTGTVTFNSTVDDSSIGAHTLTVTGNASFGGIVGSTALNSLSAATVSTTINTTAVTTSTTQAYDGATTIGGNANLSGTTVTFGSTVNDSSHNTHSLTVTGSASFGGIVGSTALNPLHVTVGITINTTAFTTSTTQAYDGATTIGGNANLSGTTVTFGSTVDDSSIGAHALTVTGSASFAGIVGSTALKSIHVTVSTTINTTAVTTSTTQDVYDGATTIGGNANLSGTTVTFGSHGQRFRPQHTLADRNR